MLCLLNIREISKKRKSTHMKLEQKVTEVNEVGHFKGDLCWGRCLHQHCYPGVMPLGLSKVGEKLETLALIIESHN